jgi:LPXTG-motif cell wall-anchored protein
MDPTTQLEESRRRSLVPSRRTHTRHNPGDTMNHRTALTLTIAALATLWPVGVSKANDGTPTTPEPVETTTAPTDTTVEPAPTTTECAFPCMADPQPEIPGAEIGIPTGTYELEGFPRLHRQGPTGNPGPDTIPADTIPADPTATTTARAELPATGTTETLGVIAAATLGLGLGAWLVTRRRDV